jgi:hypothetical protein
MVEELYPGPFQNISRTPQQHFLLHFYAAVYRLVNYIRRLVQGGGQSLEEVFAHYPFLEAYFVEMLHLMPDEISWQDGLAWWEGEINNWEKTSTEHLPLLALGRQENISFDNRIALTLIGLVEEDSRFGTLFAWLQEPLAHRRPCLEVVNQAMRDENIGHQADPRPVCQPLLSANLIAVTNSDAPRSEWVLRVPAILWDIVRGTPELQSPSWCQHHPATTFPEIKTLILPTAFQERLQQVPALLRGNKARTIILRGTPGSERLRVIGAVARALGRDIIAVPEGVTTSDSNPRPSWNLLGPLCTLTGSLPVISYDLGPGETAELPSMTGYRGPAAIIMGLEGGLRGEVVENGVTLTLPMLKADQRRRRWQVALQGYPVADLEEISERFHLPGDYIRQAAGSAIARAALERREQVETRDVREACRSLNRQLLDTLAARLEVEGSWDRLVVSEAAMAKLWELERRCRHRERLLAYLGHAFSSNSNRGVRALLTGPSGTGKTLAAKILAAELDMDLYRVDLAAVINKYIGETEKNLHRVLSRAEELDVILLLDEGDALLSSRTEVRSANDRYANLETNYLLQKLEHYQGIVIVTTNAGDNIDSAFQRRMDVVVNFIPPGAQERWHIWRLHLPGNHAVSDDYLEKVAVHCEMTGGQIRNAALHATLLALDDGSGTVRNWHLEQAVQSEYRKAGATFPLNQNDRVPQNNSGIHAFLDALAY